MYVYRSAEPILSSDALDSLAPVAVLASNMTTWKEKAESALYYYAVIARLADGSLYDILIPTVNTTLHAASVTKTETAEEAAPAATVVQEQQTYNGGLRIRPLPSFRIFNTEQTTMQTISAETLSAAQDLGLESSAKTTASLFIAEEDLADSSTGDTYLLHEIVSRYLLRKNWNSALEALRALIQTYHNEEITARINLYLGQCSYFTEDYLGALQYFLQCEALYPDVAKIWIQTTINAFTLPDFSK